jgi:hypothetical protein
VRAGNGHASLGGSQRGWQWFSGNGLTARLHLLGGTTPAVPRMHDPGRRSHGLAAPRTNAGRETVLISNWDIIMCRMTGDWSR